jgi:hypothetical protein
LACPPQEHPRISQQQVTMILADATDAAQVTVSKNQQPGQALLKLP